MEKKDWHIVPECYIDTNLAEFLLASHGVNHQKGCNAVAKKMMESNLKDYNLPQDLSEFTKVTKNVKVKDDYRFKTLFQAIENSKEVSLFRSVLNYLNKYQYQSKTEELQSLFENKS